MFQMTNAHMTLASTSRLDGTSGDDSLDGGSGKDLIRGLAGDDIINGGSGRDRLLGGGGDDTISGGAGQDTIDAGKGDDLVLASAGGNQPNLGDHVDGGVGVDTLSFEGISSTINANLEGGAGEALSDATGSMLVDGFENLIGGSGDDVFRGRLDIGSLLDGGEGDDEIHGQSGSDTLVGGAGDDSLSGSGDTLIGGAGGDSMSGGFHDDGATVFRYIALNDSTAENPDLLGDVRGHNIIDLHLLDANANKAGDQAFHLIEGAFTGHAGELLLVYDGGTDRTTLTVDVDGDAVADMTVELTGDRSDFHHFVL